MAARIINTTALDGGLSAVPVALSAPTTAGNSLIVAVSVWGNGAVIASIATDTGDVFVGLPFSNAAADSYNLSGSHHTTAIFFLPACVGNATQITVTASLSMDIWVWETTPVTFSSASFTQSGSATQLISGPTLTGTGSSNLYVACYTGEPVAGIQSPWTLDPTSTVPGGAGNAFYGGGHYIGSGARTPIFDQGSPDTPWSISAAVFEDNSTPAPPTGGGSMFQFVPGKLSDDTSTTATAINSTYCTYGFVNSTKATQNPLLGFHRKRFSEIQLNINGSGQETTKLFPNYILKNDLSFNPFAYTVPPIILQIDPPDDIVRPVNTVGNRVYVMFSTNAVGARFSLSKTIMVGVIDGWSTVNPNSG